MPFIKFLGLQLTNTLELSSNTRKGNRLKWHFSKLLHQNRELEALGPQPEAILIERQTEYLIKNLLEHSILPLLHYLSFIISQKLKTSKNIKYFLISRYKQIRGNLRTELIPYFKELKRYSNQQKQTRRVTKEEAPLTDYMTSTYSGVLLSRLYLGSTIVPHCDTPSGGQDFKLRMKPGSLIHELKSKGIKLNNHNYSSYGLNLLINKITGIERNRGTKPPFRS